MKKLLLGTRKTSLFLLGSVLSAGIAFAQPCIPAYTTGTGEGDQIEGVVLEGISNLASGGEITDVGYSDYTDLSTDLTNGETYILSVTNGDTYPISITAWIDYNQNDEFEPGEALGDLSLDAAATGDIEFTVDLLGLAGETTMRVRGVYPSGLGTLDPCDDQFYGETEDYTVNLSGGPADNLAVIAITSPNSGADLAPAPVTVEITNTGENSATEFDVSYMVDMAVVATETYTDVILPGETGTFTFADDYTFADYGCYDFEVSVVWADDGFEGDNTLNKTVCNAGPVTGTGAYYLNSNVPFGEPWGSTSNIDAMNAVFGDTWTQDFFEEVDIFDVFNGENCFVFLEGSDQHADELEAFLADNLDVIEGWVSSGGRLLLNAGPNEGDGMSFGFDGTELIYPYFTGDAIAADESHPIFMGPFTPVGTSWFGSSFGHASIEGEGLVNLIVDEFATDNVVLAEKLFGSGIVIFGGMTTNNFHTPVEEAANLRANIIAYLSCGAVEVCSPPAEVSLDDLTSTTATLSWSAVDGADQYVLAIRNNTTGERNTRQFNTTSYTFEGLTPGDSYSFRVKSVCFTELSDISAPSMQVDFSTPLRVGMAESGLNVYPNPNNGEFRIQLNNYAGSDVSLQVVNTLGQVVYANVISVMDDITVEEVVLDVVPGTYLVQIRSGEEINIHPIVIE